MHVLILSPLFPPEPVVSSQTSGQLAEALQTSGHSVTVVTAFPSRPSGKLYAGYRRKLVDSSMPQPGLKLIRCFSLFSAESSMLSRFLENISFGFTSAMAVLVQRRPDVIYSNTWPIFATGLISLVARLRRIPIVVSVQDVYPESLISQGRIKPSGILARGMRRIDQLIAHSSKKVIVISERFLKIYRDDRGVAPEHLVVIPNWADSDPISNDVGPTLRERYKIPQDAFVIAYGGNISVAAGVETLVASLNHLKDCTNTYLLVAGEGPNLQACQTLAGHIDGCHIIFHTPWPAQETSMLLLSADVLILPTRGQQSMASVPSKLISYMLSAKPIIALALPGSDLADALESSGCGWVVEPDKPELLAKKILAVSAIPPEERAQRGLSGRRYALDHYTSEACLPKVIHILEQASQHVA